MASLSGQDSRGASLGAPALPVDLLHHDLVAFVTDLEIALELGIGTAALRGALGELLEHITAELVAEERLIQAISYPDSTAHLKAHEALVLRLEGAFRLCHGIERGAFNELLECVRAWLSQHRTSMDAALAAYVSSH